MHIWTLEKWKKYYFDDSQHRRGLRLRFESSVDTEVKRAIKEFCIWLRQEYYFPKRIVVYIKNERRITAKDKDLVCATFFEPINRMDEPFIKLATGDYYELVKNDNNDNALAALLYSLTHELTHYFQWINDINLTEIGFERQATAYSKLILYEYSMSREHP